MKNKKILIGIIVVLLVVFLFIILISIIKKNGKDSKIESGNFFKYEGEYTEPNVRDVTSDSLLQNHCDDDICLSISKIVCNESKGNIYYKITNIGNESRKTGYYKISFNNNDFYLAYNNLSVNESDESVFIYYDVDLTEIEDFSFTLISDQEGKKHVIQE